MLLSAEHLSINFGSRQLLDDVNFYLNEGDKVGVIGINGTGKSTFLKVLSGVTEPDGGTISRNPNVQVSLLPQNPAMEESATVLEQVFLHFPAEFRELNEYEAKAMLNRLGITDFAQKVGTLSGGQRKRVALAAALIHPADVLILDEPTNHLDVASREWIEEAVESYEGNLLFVSHDRYFINRFATRIWMLENGQIIDFRGTFEEYRAAQERKRLQAAVPVKAEPEKPKKEKPRRPGGTKELEKQVAAAERAVAKAEERQYELTLKAEEVASNYLELQKVYDEQKALEEEIAALYTKWETLAAELEEARG